MKEAIALFSRLYEQDVELRSEGDRLQVRAAKGRLDEATRQALSTHKAQLLSLITGVGDDIPASEGQQRLWIIDQQMHNDAYHIGLCVTLDGPLDGARLAQGVNEEIAYHPALRTRLYETDSGLCQRADAEVPQVRLENDPTAEPLSLLDALASRPFSLSEAPVRARLIAVNAQRHLLLLVIHHSAADGWSLGILLNGISRRYRGEPLEQPLPAVYRPETRVEADNAWWEKLLQNAPEPVRFSAPDEGEQQARHLAIPFDTALWQQLTTLAAQSRIGLQPWLSAAFHVLLGKIFSKSALVLLTPYARRHEARDLSRVGFLANTLFTRAELPGQLTLRELAFQLAQQADEGQRHADASCAVLQARYPDAASDIMFTLEDDATSLFTLPGVVAKIDRYQAANAKFSLLMTVVSGTLPHAQLSWRVGAVTPEEAQGMAQGYLHLLRQLVATPDGAIQQMALAAGPEALPALPPAENLLIRIHRQVNATPDAVAVRAGDVCWSYATLWQRAGEVMLWLREQGVGRGDRVGVLLPAGPEALAATLGTLAAGACYVPLDVRQPAERLQGIIEDAGLRVVIDDRQVPAQAMIAEWSFTLPESKDLAWMIFTSGSTGKPKAAMVHHGGVSRLLEWYCQLTGTEALRDVIVSNPSFDLTQKNLFAPLMCGGEVVFPAMDVFDARSVLTAIHRHRATLINCTPTAFNTLLQEAKEDGYRALASLRWVILGGETILLTPLQQWQQESGTQARVVNSYGPTECSDVVASYLLAADLSAQAEPVPLGRAIAGARLLIVDAHGQPVPDGIAGELMIDGDGVGPGYYQRPQLTARQFLAHGSGTNGLRYLSGDRVRRLPEGELQFLGRNDRQIKLNGYRIETDEIESALLKSGLVKESAVVVRHDDSGHAILVAFFCCEGRAPSEEALRAGLRQMLPLYSIPARFVQLPSLPLTRSGKIDRNALPLSLPAAVDATSGEALQTPLEVQVAAVWASLLRVPVEHRHVDFFAAGGHSLLAMQVIREIRKMTGIPASTGMLLRHSTLAEFAGVLAKMSLSEETTQPALADDAIHPLTPMQKRLWFLWRLEGASSDYSMSAAWSLNGPLEPQRLMKALETVVARHILLGSRLVETDRGPGYQFQPGDNETLLEYHLLDAAAFPAFRAAFHAQPIDLSRDRFLRAALVKIAEEQHFLLVNIHHIAADGLSLPVLLADLQQAWEGKRFSEPAVPFYRLVGEQQGAMSALHEHWRKYLADAPQTSLFPADRPTRDRREATVVALDMDEAHWEAVNQQARALGVTPFVLLLASWFILLYRYTRQSDLVLGVPVALRDTPQSENVIGPLLNTVPVYIQFQEHDSVIDSVQKVSQAFDGAVWGATLPFEEIVEVTNPLRQPGLSPLFQIQVVQDPATPAALSLPGLETHLCPALEQNVKYDLNIHFQPTENGFGGYLAARRDFYGINTLNGIIQAWHCLLAAMAADGSRPIRQLPLMDAEGMCRLVARVGRDDPTLPGDDTLAGIFVAQVRKTPAAIALIGDGVSMTYAELEQRANQVAHGLVAKGIQSGDRVSVCLPRGVERVAVMYGVLLAGAAWVPVDPQWPEERQQMVITQANPVFHIDPDKAAQLRTGQPTTPVLRRVFAEQECYVMFTSGSTGIPKGVPIRHGGVAHDLHYLIRRLSLAEGDRVFQLTAFGFDPSVRDLFATLGSGATAVMVDDETATHPGRILAAMNRHQVTHVVSMVPTMLRALLTENISVSTLRVLMLNGERLRGDDLSASWHRFGSTLQIINQYGPTEATMTSATHIATADDLDVLTVPLGVANPNTGLWVMDDYGELLPAGATGEICISGAGLSTGYLHGRSPEAFTSRIFPDGQTRRVYRSGDLGRWRDDGVLEFLGRLDFQIKLRGNRIELGEIDACLGQMPGVRHCAVNLTGDAQNPVLCAWLSESAPGSVDKEQLRQQLKAKLPAWMVPAVFVVLPELPLTASGKVDRKRLPTRTPVNRTGVQRGSTQTEKLVSDVWQTLLGLPEAPDVETNFFELGANSLLMVQASERLSTVLGKTVPIVDLFAHPTIRALSLNIDAQTPNTGPVPTADIAANAAQRRAALSGAGSRQRSLQTQRKNS
ncbi:amino acid adenylation domain-containing protein [Enterobacter cloacae]|uniref:amino acid adenylation domain-containing protein n=1 Tax=Enterobacter cloacae TaxID=550 RepID=UPI002FF5CC07